MKDTEVSLIIPIYNVRPYLEQCLDSVLAQSFRNMEILIIDDGSTDGSGEICDQYAERDERITVFHTDNHGLSAARNYGLDRMKGRYVAFLDSDDWMEENAIQILHENLENTDADIVVCANYYEYDGTSVRSASSDNKLILNGRDGLENYLYEPYIRSVVWNKMYRAELFGKIRYPVGRAFEDVAVMYMLIESAEKLIIIPDYLFHYRIRAGSLARDFKFKNISDHWISTYEKYEYLSTRYPKYSDALIKPCINVIFKMWRWYHQYPECDKKAAGPILDQMQDFAEMHRKQVLRLDSGSNVFEKLGCMCARYRNPVVFAALYWLTQIYRRIKSRKAYK